MDARMLRYYNQELAYMREMGAEFAAAFPRSPRGWRSMRPRSPIRTSSGCWKDSASSRPGSRSSSTRSFRASPSTCSSACIRTTSRRRRRWPSCSSRRR